MNSSALVPTEFRDRHLSGVWAAVPIPWNRGGRVDAGALRELVARYQAAGVHGVYSTGTDGEFHVLDLEAFEDVTAAFARAVADAGLPAQVGVSWINADGIYQRARVARELGFRCIQTTIPFWMPLNDGEILRFFNALADRFPDVGVVSYNTARTGRSLQAVDFRRLLDAGSTVIGSKHEGNDDELLASVSAAPEIRHFVVDGGIVPGLLLGASGMYSFVVNVSPGWAMRFWKRASTGDWAGAIRDKQTLGQFLAAFERVLGPSVTAWASHAKAAVACALMVDMPLAVRPPYEAATRAQVRALRRLIAQDFPEFGPDR